MPGTSYYDGEAPAYDESRGGEARARAAAAAICSLVPSAAGKRGVCVDVAGGTGIVSAELSARGLDVLVVDLSTGMLRVAQGRLPGRVLLADGSRLPLADASVDLVTTVWLLHLVPQAADAIIAEVARVVRPGGHWVTSVDKDLAHRSSARTDADEASRVTGVAARLGLVAGRTTTFTGATVWGSAQGAGQQEFRLAAYRRTQ